MNARGRQRSALSTIAPACAPCGCEWVAGIEDTTVADAGQMAGDAAPGLGDGGGKPGSAAPGGCPAPCLFDAVAEFAYVTYTLAHFRGRLAELRVLGEALPCSAP